MTYIEMEVGIARWFGPRTHLIVPNISWGMLNHEADIFVVRSSGYSIEVEIKRSFSDYIKDFTKRKWRYHKHGLGNKIKEFYYAFPEKLWEKREYDIMECLPDFAGVLVCTDAWGVTCMKKAVANRHAKPLTDKEMFQVARLGTLRIWTLKRTIIGLLRK